MPKNRKRTNTNSMRNNRIANSAVYKPLKPNTKDYQKSNNGNQTDNKQNNDYKDMRKRSHLYQKEQ